MKNIMLREFSKETEEKSTQFGYSKTLFLDQDLVLINANTKKELVKKTSSANTKNLLTIYKPESEEMLRFALEKTKIDIIFGMELINQKDSVHYPRSGIDTVMLRIAAQKNKIIAFSFTDILNSSQKGTLLGRMMFTIKMCKKYNVKTLFSTFATCSEEIRAAKDLEVFWRVLNSN